MVLLSMIGELGLSDSMKRGLNLPSFAICKVLNCETEFKTEIDVETLKDLISDYIKEEGGKVYTSDIAEHFSLSMATVISTLEKLKLEKRIFSH